MLWIHIIDFVWLYLSNIS